MKKKKRFENEKFRRGIYILPNIFTTLNIFSGFYSIISSVNGNYATAAVSILVAVVFDIMDGKVARVTQTTSKFGVEYDSLADLISFGLAPALMIYLWALKPLGRLGWLAAFLFMACGALRLARFNSHVGTSSSEYFTGLPIPAGAGMCATTVLLFSRFALAGDRFSVMMLVMLYILSFLMVSTVKYHSFKKPELYTKMNFNVLVAAVLILIFIASQPPIALFMLGLCYVISGPYFSIHTYRNSRQADAPAQETEKPESHLV